MIKILLVNPYYQIGHPPLGLAYLASYARKHSVKPLEFQLYDEITDHRDITTILCAYRPDMIAISIVTPTFGRALALCWKIRDVSTAPIVAGGPHITAAPESILGTPIDIGVIGEGEATFLEIIQCFLETRQVKNPAIKGISFVQEGRMIRTSPRPLIADMDTIPPPDRTLFAMKGFYARPKKLAHGLYAKGTSIMPSRGCPYGNCNFCSSGLTWGNTPRFFSPLAVVEEMEALVRDNHCNSVIFLDDNFTTDFKWLQALSALMRERGLQQAIRFDCESIAAFLSDRCAALLKEMGCVRIEFGFESGCERILHILKSGNAKLKHNEAAIETCKRHGIFVLGNAIFGYIDETPEEFDESASWFLERPIDFIAQHIYTPYPGTTGWNECIARGIIDPREINWDQFNTSFSERNFIANAVYPKELLFEKFNANGERFSRRNKSLIIESGLSNGEKICLYSLTQECKKTRLLFRIDQMGPHISARRISEAGFFIREIGRELLRIKRFIASRDKVWRLRSKFLPGLPLPARLPSGELWLAWNDVMGKHVYQHEDFEIQECRVLDRLLSAGMMVFDIGAHQGFFSLLFSRKVGGQGAVVAFEPSPRENRRLRWNLQLNRCRNVQVVAGALGKQTGQADLFVCLGRETGCNSLRLPAVAEPVSKLSVPITTLDRFMTEQKIGKLDFIKMDVEGAELEVMQGGDRTLERLRPLILCELSDLRTAPWGYRSQDICRHLLARDYLLFSFSGGGNLIPCPDKKKYNENILAVPREKESTIAETLRTRPCS